MGDGSRLPKTAPLIHALGDVDELNSHIGVLRSMALPEDVDTLLSDIQHDLFDMGAELCIPGHQVIGSAHVERLDQAIRHYNEPLGILKEFILPGGSPAAAQAHVLRCVARRAERSVVAVPSEALPQDGPRLYLNRLSDLLFVLARRRPPLDFLELSGAGIRIPHCFPTGFTLGSVLRITMQELKRLPLRDEG